MNTITKGEKQIAAGEVSYTTGFVTAKDGTTLGYRQLGHGPGLMLLHGAMSSAHNHMQLAQALADAFTVYVPDRRGRGLSGPFHQDYSIQQEVDDLDDLLTKTGAHNVFGVSSGGLICLQAAGSLPAIHKAAIFEPPLFNNNSTPASILARYDREISEGKIAAALITGMLGGQMGPPIFNLIPRPILEWLVNLAMKGEAKKSPNGYVPMRALAPLLHYDFQLATEMSGPPERFRTVPVEVLLLGGSQSPAYLKAALAALVKVLPHAKHIELPGLGHAASWNSDRGGQPGPVAQELHRFFA